MAGIQTADPMISTVTLVPASKALGFSGSTEALAASISTLALAASVIPTGLIADRAGRRRVLLIALIVAALGDLLAAASPNALIYLAGRTVAGIGLGAVFGASFALVARVAGQQLGSALGLFTAMASVTTLAGAFVGGALASASWRVAFCVVPALCAAALLAAVRIVPGHEPAERRPADVLGLALLAAGTVGILFGLSNASASLAAPRTWLPVVLGVAALGLFGLVESRSDHPAFPIGLLRNRVFAAAVIAGLGWNLAQSVTVLQLSNLWQYVDRYSTIAVTFGQLPFSIVAIAGAIVVGRQLSRGVAASHLILAAFGAMVAGFGSLWFIRPGAPYWAFLPALILIGVGIAAASVPQARLFMSEAPPEYFGPVTSSRLTTGQFGFALGLTGSAVLISSLTRGGVTRRLLAAGVPPSQLGQGLDAVSAYVRTGAGPGTAAGRQALRSAAPAYLHAFNTTMLLVAVMMGVAGLAMYLMLAGSARTRASEQSPSRGRSR